VVDGAPAEVTNGIYLYEPWGAVESGGYRRLQRMLGRQEIDPYTTQTYDHASLIALALQAGGAASGEAVRDHIRAVARDGGEAVDNAVDGIRLLRDGKTLNYSGASGPCRFTPSGDIGGAVFRWQRITNKRFETVRVE
jgi:branched-chain amino acid transport system substrate-binding protein